MKFTLIIPETDTEDGNCEIETVLIMIWEFDKCRIKDSFLFPNNLSLSNCSLITSKLPKILWCGFQHDSDSFL